MPTSTPPASPADTAIAESRAAYDAFLAQANAEVYAPQAASRAAATTPPLNPVADALARATPTARAADQLGNQLSTAAQQATGTADTRARTADGRFAPATQPPTPTLPSPTPPPPSAPAASPLPAGTVPGPPEASSPASSQAAADPAASSPAQPSAADDFADVPPANALDQPGSHLKSTNWRRLHAKADAYATQVEQLRRELAQAKSTAAPATPAPEIQQQLTALTTERDQLLATIERVAFEQSPRFKQQFSQREQAAILLAKGSVAPDQAATVESLLKQPDSPYRNQQLSAILAAVSETDPIRAGKLTTAIAALDSLAAEKAVVLENSKQHIAQLQAEQASLDQRRQAERQAAVSTTFDQTVREWKTAGATLDDSDIALARDIFTGNRTLQDIANAAMWVAAGPRAAVTARALQQQLDAANAELTRLRSVQPSAAPDAGGTIGDEPPTNQAPHQGMYMDGIIEAAMKAGLPLR